MNYEHILFNIKNNVGCIRLNRPDTLNSFNIKMAVEMQNALSFCTASGNVRAVYISGEGRAFSAGQDLGEIMESGGPGASDAGDIVRNSYNPIIRLIRHMEKPVIAAVNGVAAGAGANIALACDIVFAAHTAYFVQSFIKIGLIPDSGGTFILPRLIGLHRATAALLTGEKIMAEIAYEMGMIYKVCEAENLQHHALSFAEQMACLPTKAIGLTKRAINSAFSNNLDSQLDLEENLQGEAGFTEDYAEGVRAFIEKRPPVFNGR